MPLDGTEKGPGATNTEAPKNAKRTGQTEVTPDARRAEPVLRSYIAAGYELIALNVAGALDRKGRKIGKALPDEGQGLVGKVGHRGLSVVMSETSVSWFLDLASGRNPKDRP